MNINISEDRLLSWRMPLNNRYSAS